MFSLETLSFQISLKFYLAKEFVGNYFHVASNENEFDTEHKFEAKHRKGKEVGLTS